MDVKLGTRRVTFPSRELESLVPNNDLLEDGAAMRNQLHHSGYLYFKHFHDRQEVLAARRHVLDYIASTGDSKLDDVSGGVLNARCGLGCVPFMEGKTEITHTAAVRRVLEGHRPFDLFHRIFGSEATTFDYKWLRAMHREGFTGAHVDNVYMSRGTDKVLTMWTPFCDSAPDIGTLAVCEGSNGLGSFQKFQDTYGKLDVEAENLKGTGWFTEDPLEISSQFGGTWKTANFEAGDILIFTLRTVHMSTVNLTNVARISCDTRWQPKNEPIDERYFGEQANKEKPQFGVWADNPQNRTVETTMDLLKESWGFKEKLFN